MRLICDRNKIVNRKKFAFRISVWYTPRKSVFVCLKKADISDSDGDESDSTDKHIDKPRANFG